MSGSITNKGFLRQANYRIDATTSDYWADPARANLQQVGETVVSSGAGYTTTVELGSNALQLIVLAPVETTQKRR